MPRLSWKCGCAVGKNPAACDGTQCQRKDRTMTPYEYQQLALRTENTPTFLFGTNGAVDYKSLSRLAHAAIGICTEVGELQDALKKELIYGKPIDPVNVLEECGDVLWYLAIGFDAIKAKLAPAFRPMNHPVVPLWAPALSFIRDQKGTACPDFSCALVGTAQILKSAGRIQDVITAVFHKGEFPFASSIQPELNNAALGVWLVLHGFCFSMEEAAKRNIAKLQARYPGKFTSEAALNRDLEKERAALEVDVPLIFARGPEGQRELHRAVRGSIEQVQGGSFLLALPKVDQIQIGALQTHDDMDMPPPPPIPPCGVASCDYHETGAAPMTPQDRTFLVKKALSEPHDSEFRVTAPLLDAETTARVVERTRRGQLGEVEIVTLAPENLPLMAVNDMIRGLVRAAEYKEQDDGGKVWDDSIRKALEAARQRGWGKHQIGTLGAWPVLATVPLVLMINGNEFRYSASPDETLYALRDRVLFARGHDEREKWNFYTRDGRGAFDLRLTVGDLLKNFPSNHYYFLTIDAGHGG
jgi:hypothetical protein